ncbi:hypothetical protein HYT18_00455 [Candidatus Microgenomates bacterium]|nr:hypothetical protein [Candidatus Microgenomates bacterium]
MKRALFKFLLSFLFLIIFFTHPKLIQAHQTVANNCYHPQNQWVSCGGANYCSGVNLVNDVTTCWYTGPSGYPTDMTNHSSCSTQTGVLHQAQAPLCVVDASTCTAISVNSGNPVNTGGNYSATVGMRNDGTSTWSSGNNYKLGSQDPQDNTVWGLNRVSLPSNISPGGTANFNFNVTAPSTAGTYSFNWQMLREGVHWFGSKCSYNVAVNPVPTPTPTRTPTPTPTPTPRVFSPPTVITDPATSITQTSATLNSRINPNGSTTTSWFRYSTTSPGTSCNDTFGTRAPTSGGNNKGSGTSEVADSQNISGLTAATTYYFCAIANNIAGTSFGLIRSFLTLTVTPTPTPTRAPTPLPTPTPGGPTLTPTPTRTPTPTPTRTPTPTPTRTPTPTPTPTPGGVSPWFQTTGGDVHSNSGIDTQGGP